jgi:hypothetical protein
MDMKNAKLTTACNRFSSISAGKYQVAVKKNRSEIYSNILSASRWASVLFWSGVSTLGGFGSNGQLVRIAELD